VGEGGGFEQKAYTGAVGRRRLCGKPELLSAAADVFSSGSLLGAIPDGQEQGTAWGCQRHGVVAEFDLLGHGEQGTLAHFV
ncbi:MAG: hypothetical protein J7M26_06315, partial [Armatimonadetes bacterium]|nr:hypothetical protein [Armatimonadota bacterium]